MKLPQWRIRPALAAAGGLVLCQWLFLSSALAQVEDCPRGTLDSRYCDRDGDLVADVPADPKQWLDPATLIFSYTPVEDPEVYLRAWEPLLRHVEKLTGRKVQFFSVQSNAAQRHVPAASGRSFRRRSRTRSPRRRARRRTCWSPRSCA